MQQVKEQERLDLVWGAKNIGKVIGKEPRETFHLLTTGKIRATKVGSQWVASKSGLRAQFAAILGENA
jgi:hypothetical protein